MKFVSGLDQCAVASPPAPKLALVSGKWRLGNVIPDPAREGGREGRKGMEWERRGATNIPKSHSGLPASRCMSGMVLWMDPTSCQTASIQQTTFFLPTLPQPHSLPAHLCRLHHLSPPYVTVGSGGREGGGSPRREGGSWVAGGSCAPTWCSGLRDSPPPHLLPLGHTSQCRPTKHAYTPPF